MRSPRAVTYERIKALANERDRFVDVAFRFRVYRRGADGKAAPAELLPRLYGGRFDRWLRGFAETPPEHVVEFPIHPGQIELLTAEGPRRSLALGAAGGGKSQAIALKAIELAVSRPCSTIGVVVAVAPRKKDMLRYFTELLDPLGWIENISASKSEITLVTRTLIQIVAARAADKATGTPFQGLNWDAAVEDEQQNIGDKADRKSVV